MEHWKPAPTLEGYYEVSSAGRIRSLPRKTRSSTIKGQLIKLQTDKDGYQTFHSAKNGVRRHEKVHRLVALAFIPNPEGLSDVNHIDEDKTNNTAANLEWLTTRDNIHHGTNLERRRKTKAIPVYGLCEKTGTLRMYPSIRETEKDGFREGHVCSCLRGKLLRHKRYIWAEVPAELAPLVKAYFWEGTGDYEALENALRRRLNL